MTDLVKSNIYASNGAQSDPTGALIFIEHRLERVLRMLCVGAKHAEDTEGGDPSAPVAPTLLEIFGAYLGRRASPVNAENAPPRLATVHDILRALLSIFEMSHWRSEVSSACSE